MVVGLVGDMADEEACMFALQLANSTVLPMTLRTAIELGLLEALVGAAGKSLTPEEVLAKLPCNVSPSYAADHYSCSTL